MILFQTSKERIWIQALLSELGFKQEKNVLHSDSQSSIALVKNSLFHQELEHIGHCYLPQDSDGG